MRSQSDSVSDAILAMRAEEALRQEKETFEQRKIQENKWFRLRLTVGYASIILLALIMLIASMILFDNSQFPSTVVTAAGVALFGDVLGLLIAIWKIVLNPNSAASLAPVTRTTGRSGR
jgi:hypothetical protein